MKVQVLLFARARELAGAERLEIELGAGASAGDAFVEVARRVPRLADLRERLAVAINERYASWEDPVVGGDTIALIPPVSGG